MAQAPRPVGGGAGERPGIGALLLLYGGACWVCSLLLEWLLAQWITDVRLLALASTAGNWIWTGLSLLLLHRALRGNDASRHQASGLLTGHPRRLRRIYAAWLAGVALTLALGLGLILLHAHDDQARRLEVIARVRATEVGDYLGQRLSYGDFMRHSAAMSGLWERWTTLRDEAAGEALVARMSEFRRAAGFRSIVLADPDGRPAWSERQFAHWGEDQVAMCRRSVSESRSLIGPIHDDGPALPGQHLDVALPVSGDAGKPVRFVAVLQIDVGAGLRTLLERKLVDGAQVEVALWERQGGELVTLRPGAGGTGAAGAHRWPLAQASHLAARVLRGEATFGQAYDGAGEVGAPVIAAAAAVPDSPLIVVASSGRSQWLAAALLSGAWALAASALAGVAGLVVIRSLGQRAELARVRAEQAAQAMRHRAMMVAQAVADGSADVIFAKDVEGRYLLFNAAAARVTGQDAAAVVGRNDIEIFGDADGRRYMDDDRSVRESGSVNTFEESIEGPMGLRHMQTFKGPIRGPGGEVIGSFGIARDVTEERKVQQALEQSERLFRAVIDHAPDAFFVVRADGSIAVVNRVAATDTGYTREELLALPIGKLGPAIDPAFIAAISARARAEGPQSFESPIRRKDGSRYDAAVRLALMNVDGQDLAFVFVHDLTAQHDSAAALADSRSRLQRALDASAMGVWDYDVEAGRYHWSPEVYRLVGLPAQPFDAALGREAVEAGIVDEDRERALGELQHALETGERLVSEFRVRCADGRERWVLDIGSVVTDAQGRRRVVGTVQDIDARKRAELELVQHREHLAQLVQERTAALTDALHAREASEGFLRMVTDALPNNVAYYRKDMVCLFANRAYLGWLGRSEAEVVGHALAELLPPQRLAYDQPLIDRALAGESVTTDYEGVYPRTAEPYFAVAHLIPHHQGGEVTGMLFVAVDVTRSRQAEQEARRLNRQLTGALRAREQSEGFLRSVTEAIPAAVGYFDQQERCRFANSKYAARFKATPGEVIGRRLSELLGAEPMLPLRGYVTRVLAGGAFTVDEVSPADGRMRYALAHWLPDLRGGEVRGFLYVSSEVTELKAAQRALELANVELAHARERADAANRAKSAFLANMSHEIRTPLNAVTGMAHLLLRDLKDPVARERASRIAEAARHLLSLISDILDLSKIDAGKLVLASADFDAQALLARVTGLVIESARAKGLELVIDACALPPVLHGDATRLSQALLNLLSNAVKFTEQGWIGLSAAVIGESEQGHLLRFEVTDTGVGIEPEQQASLFQPFEQADSSTTRRHGGTGLGLAITRLLAGLMGGEVGVQSLPGSGSTFWITVRMRAATPQEDVAASPPALQGLRAVVVDDLGAARSAIAALLHQQGMQVRGCDSGEALLRGAAEDADVILIDEQMPRLDGFATLQRLRGDAPSAALPPCVLLGADDGAPLRRRAQAAGFAAVLPKPVAADALRDLLLRLLRGEPSPVIATAEPAAAVAPGEPFTGARVLLVEDNDVNREVAVDLLESFGLEVEEAVDGVQAVDLAGSGRHDLVLMDVQMPRMDGLQATRAIHALPGRERLPVIAVTANAFGEDREACLAAGMCDYLAKPVDPAQLEAVLARWLPERPRAPRREAAPPEAEASSAGAIAGIDEAEGLRHCGGDAELHDRLLLMFAARHGDATALREALAAGDRPTLRQLAHSLKGASGAIGAMQVNQQALELELAAAGAVPDEILRTLVDRMDRRLAELSAAVRAHLEDEYTRPAALDAAEAGDDAIDRLEALLAASDFGAVVLYRDIAPQLLVRFGESARLIREALARFDFDEALAQLRRMRAAH